MWHKTFLGVVCQNKQKNDFVVDLCTSLFVAEYIYMYEFYLLLKEFQISLKGGVLAEFVPHTNLNTCMHVKRSILSFTDILYMM